MIHTLRRIIGWRRIVFGPPKVHTVVFHTTGSLMRDNYPRDSGGQKARAGRPPGGGGNRANPFRNSPPLRTETGGRGDRLKRRRCDDTIRTTTLSYPPANGYAGTTPPLFSRKGSPCGNTGCCCKNALESRERNSVYNNERRGFLFGFGSHRLCQGRLVVCHRRRLPKLPFRAAHLSVEFPTRFRLVNVSYSLYIIYNIFSLFLVHIVVFYYRFFFWCFVFFFSF